MIDQAKNETTFLTLVINHCLVYVLSTKFSNSYCFVYITRIREKELLKFIFTR